MSCVEAAECLGTIKRRFRRLRDRHEHDRAEGVIDRRRGKTSIRRAPVDTIEWLLERLAHDGAADSNALALAARQLPGLALEQPSMRGIPAAEGDPRLDLGLGQPRALEPEGEILIDREH